MRLGLLFLFLAVPLVELALLIRVGQDLGVWATLALGDRYCGCGKPHSPSPELAGHEPGNGKRSAGPTAG